MTTRDLHDQKTLKALQGIESQLKEFNKNFAKAEVNNKKHTLAIHYQDGILMKSLDSFTNSDGTVTPIIPSKNIYYYVKYKNVNGGIYSTVITGSQLVKENEILIELAIDIFFYCEYEFDVIL